MANLAEVVASAPLVEELRTRPQTARRAAGRFPRKVTEEAVAAPSASKETEARDDEQEKEKERDASCCWV